MKTVKKDDYYTPDWVWEEIAPILKNNNIKNIYEPFNNKYNKDSLKSRVTLNKLGFKVLDIPPYDPKNNNYSFFNNLINQDDYDCIVSNIPFSKKKWIIEHCKLVDKPFCLLIPPYALCSKYVKKLDKDKVGIIIPSKRIDFQNANRPTNCSRWEAVWLTYKLNNKLLFLS